MTILLLAPQPFYEERGTPIAVKWVAETLASFGHRVDLVTFPFGETVVIPGVNIHRAARPLGVRRVPIGFSIAKLRCDVGLYRIAHRLARQNRYDVVHACEEAIFFARPLAKRARAKIVYDMDSSMADQLMEKWAWLRPFAPLLYAFERYAVRSADLVLPVCEALGRKVEAFAPGKPWALLSDMAMEFPPIPPETEPLRKRLGIRGALALYVGNLEHYQGVGLLLEAVAAANEPSLDVVIIGGRDADVAAYRQRAGELGVADRVHFLGPRPVNRLMYYLEQADILVSPRIRGVNTPMKVYSYLAAGRAIVATRIESHTQVLDESVARMVEPTPAAFAAALAELARDPEARARLGAAAAARAKERHSREAYQAALRQAYSMLTSGPVVS